jgi:predicted enzyme related to lactoylglutathione lyase
MMLADKPVISTLPVVDLQRARMFYEKTLGLGSPASSSEADVTYNCGNGTKLYLYQREQTRADHTVISFLVDDVEQEVKELKDKGVTFESFEMQGFTMENNIASWKNGKAAWFKDSEGNIIAITQMG